jgi:hypothetical protein
LAHPQNLIKNEKIKCEKVFGHKNFCDCIVSRTPISIGFTGYVEILVLSKEELGYADLSEKDKSLVDKTRKVRDQCVKKFFREKK